ncbi:MAG: response regulator [Candidatus Sulfobium sp.]
MKILVVDDDPDLGRLCKEELEEEGYEVMTAFTGAGAMETFRRENPELVVLDIKLPDVDGLELLTRMKEIRRNVPVIMHTAFDYMYDLACDTSDAYVVKSGDFRELKAAVKRIVNKRREGPGDEE